MKLGFFSASLQDVLRPWTTAKTTLVSSTKLLDFFKVKNNCWPFTK